MEEVQAGREAVRAAKRKERQQKQAYAVRREQVGYRFSMFKAQAASRGKRVELLRHEFAGMLRRPCLWARCHTSHLGERSSRDGYFCLFYTQSRKPRAA